jgi:hypothetical protein
VVRCVLELETGEREGRFGVWTRAEAHNETDVRREIEEELRRGAHGRLGKWDSLENESYGDDLPLAGDQIP